MKIKSAIFSFLFFWASFVCQFALASAPPPASNTTAPYNVTYTAKLTSPTNTPITASQSVRFSLWTDADFDAADIDGVGDIDTLSAGFAGWQETHTVTPNSEGIFTVQLGSINVFPNFTSSTHLFMEVDVKPSASPNTAFEVLDPDGNTANLTDRKPFNSVPYAINADTVDNRDAGFGPGQIPYLNGSSLLDFTILPGGVNQETFILDQDDTLTVAGSIKLQFGDLLGKYLEYDLVLGWFNFNDDVNITGNFTVNGVPIGPYDQSLIYEPQYSDTSISQDGADNFGKMEVFFVDTDGTPGNDNYNHYKFSTRKATMQDMDLVVRFKIPEGFDSWKAVPVELIYKTEDGVLVNNRVDVSIEDTTGTSIALGGAGALVSSSWTSAPITFGGVPTFTPGESITVKIKMSALSAKAAYVGKLKFNFKGS